MNKSCDEVEFYGLGSKRTNFKKIEEINSVGQNPVNNGLNSAKKNILKKDINILDNKLKNILDGINLFFESHNFEKIIEGNIYNVNDIVTSIEHTADELIKEKQKNKVYFLSSNKKNKKQRLKELQDCLEYLAISQNKIISIKNEYNKIYEKSVSLVSNENKKDTLINEEEKLERTIRFYMNKV